MINFIKTVGLILSLTFVNSMYSQSIGTKDSEIESNADSPDVVDTPEVTLAEVKKDDFFEYIQSHSF